MELRNQVTKAQYLKTNRCGKSRHFQISRHLDLMFHHCNQSQHFSIIVINRLESRFVSIYNGSTKSYTNPPQKNIKHQVKPSKKNVTSLKKIAKGKIPWVYYPSGV